MLGCSEESEDQAKSNAEWACRVKMQACDQEWFDRFQPLAVLDMTDEESEGEPIVIIEAIEAGVVLGHVLETGEVVGPTTDLEDLSQQLLAMTGVSSIWLAGPPEYFVCEDA